MREDVTRADGVGVVLLALVLVGPKTLWGLVGLVPLLTGIAGICPLYSLFGVKTCPTPGAEAVAAAAGKGGA